MAKRANKEGTISKRKDGRWEIKYYDCYEKRRTAYAKTQAEAKDKLRAVLNDVDNGIDVMQNKMSFTAWLEEWLEVYARPSIKASTYSSYHNYVYKHIKPTMPKLLLKDLRAEHLQKLFNQKKESGRLDGLEGGLSDSTIKKMKNMIHAALKQAQINGVIMKNVSEMVKLPKMMAKEVIILSLDDQCKLEQSVLASDVIETFGIYLSLSTGIRLGEVLGLQWKDIDFEKKILTVRRTLNRVQTHGAVTKTEIAITPPKTFTSQREIPLSNRLCTEMLRHKSAQDEQKTIATVAYDDNDYVVANMIGKFYEPRTYQDLFKRQLKLAELSDINFHALRHTFATRALEASLDIYVLSKILGHAQPSTTLNKYGHALPDHKKASMEKLENYMLSKD